jgi:hypothetical protein
MGREHQFADAPESDLADVHQKQSPSTQCSQPLLAEDSRVWASLPHMPRRSRHDPLQPQSTVTWLVARNEPSRGGHGTRTQRRSKEDPQCRS